MAGQGMTELQKAWIAYLRAHPDQQTEGYLRDSNGRMCCLGAAAQLMIERGVVSGYEWASFGDTTLYLTLRSLVGKVATRYLLPEFWKTLGLNDDSGSFMVDGQPVYQDVDDKYCCSLAHMNDCGVTWPQIADFIEANPHMVFANCGGGK